jgi:SP family general alpha glucoside:H+ symporter-like MFS transporter
MSASSPKQEPVGPTDVWVHTVDEGKSARHADARDATNREHSLSLRDSFRLYPKAIAFSIVFSTAIIMEGYDLALIGSFYGYEA